MATDGLRSRTRHHESIVAIKDALVAAAESVKKVSVEPETRA
ncbi:hypothetical protein [Halorhabdus amylolytica]|nr:hypothetical protein [Halorhabdus amylolytica]